MGAYWKLSVTVGTTKQRLCIVVSPLKMSFEVPFTGKSSVTNATHPILDRSIMSVSNVLLQMAPGCKLFSALKTMTLFRTLMDSSNVGLKVPLPCKSSLTNATLKPTVSIVICVNLTNVVNQVAELIKSLVALGAFSVTEFFSKIGTSGFHLDLNCFQAIFVVFHYGKFLVTD